MKTSSFHEESFPKELFLTLIVRPAIEVISIGHMLEKYSQSQVAQITHGLTNWLRI